MGLSNNNQLITKHGTMGKPLTTYPQFKRGNQLYIKLDSIYKKAIHKGNNNVLYIKDKQIFTSFFPISDVIDCTM
jgi:hypothetical protein